MNSRTQYTPISELDKLNRSILSRVRLTKLVGLVFIEGSVKMAYHCRTSDNYGVPLCKQQGKWPLVVFYKRAFWLHYFFNAKNACKKCLKQLEQEAVPTNQA